MANKYTSQQAAIALDNPSLFPPKDIAGMILEGYFTLDEIEKKVDAKRFLLIKERVDAGQGRVMQDRLWARCTSPDGTIEDLQNFISQYSDDPRVQEARAMIERMREAQVDKDFFRLTSDGTSSITDYQAFLDKYPGSRHEKDVRDRIQLLRDQQEEGRWQACQTLDDFVTFINEFPYSKYQSVAQQRVKDLREAQEMREREEDDAMWRQVCMIPRDSPARMEAIRSYMMKYTLHRAEAQNMIDEAQLEPAMQALFSNPVNRASDFIEFCVKFPSAKERVKNWLKVDMKSNPSRYTRKDIIDLTTPGSAGFVMFSSDELDRDGILPREFYQYILSHPSTDSDRNSAEASLPPETYFGSQPDTTDVFFFGVPGSGKTTVLSSLISMTTKFENIKFKLNDKGAHVGFNYAMILKSYIDKNVFPTSTMERFETQNVTDDETIDKSFIQIVDAEIQEDTAKGVLTHKISLIDMPGERTLKFAGARGDITDLDEALGTGTSELFCNSNHKIIFFVLDSQENASYKVKYNNQIIPVSADMALNSVVTLLMSIPEVASKIVSIHAIMTKSDLVKPSVNEVTVNNALRKYESFTSSLVELCDPSKNDINSHCGHIPYVFPFTLGQVFPGNMVRQKPYEAGKILKVITENTYSVRKDNKWDSFTEKMNKILFKK